jgi:protocatechuate 3,4-dioxygenase beta subunit
MFGKDHKPRIAFNEQRNGVRHYYVEVWACYESGCMYSKESETTTSLPKAQKMLKKITDEEFIKSGVI